MPIISNTAEYSVAVYDRDATTFALESDTRVEVTNFKNLGYSDYLNDVPEAFFTLDQDDPIIADLIPLLGRAHIRITRRSDQGSWTVFGGWLGTEIDSRSDDVIIYAHGYMSSLFYLHTEWNTTWNDAHLGTIAGDLWTRAQVGATGTELGWATTGTIQAPATTSGGATPIILPVYQTFYKRILFALRDLSDIARSDTTNAVVFEITPTGVFNFWGAKGGNRDVVYEYGTRDLADFQVIQTPVDRRNRVLAVGMSPRDLVLRTETAVANAGWGRREEALLLQWVRDQTELERVARHRLMRANRDFLQLRLMFHPGAVIPPMGYVSAPFQLSDRIKVRINKGTLDVDKFMLVSGIQVLYLDGLEHVRLMVEDI